MKLPATIKLTTANIPAPDRGVVPLPPTPQPSVPPSQIPPPIQEPMLPEEHEPVREPSTSASRAVSIGSTTLRPTMKLVKVGASYGATHLQRRLGTSVIQAREGIDAAASGPQEVPSRQQRMADRNLSGRAIGRQFHRAETPTSSLTSRVGQSCLLAPQGVSARRIDNASKSVPSMSSR